MRQDKMYRLTTISNPNVFILEFYVWLHNNVFMNQFRKM
jgi:hypothetical protein